MNKILFGDCRASLKKLAADGVKVQMCVTSPPYFGLRDYGVDGQLGLEETPEEFIANMVEVFRCVRDVLADDGTLWVNMGDSYATSGGAPTTVAGSQVPAGWTSRAQNHRTKPAGGVKPKDLFGIPWMLAFALRADGWFLRQDIIWHKPNPMPESVRDRCTKAHEYIFLLSKSERYFYDCEAIKEPSIYGAKGGTGVGWGRASEADPRDNRVGRGRQIRPSAPKGSFNGKTEAMAATGQNAFRAITDMRNRRSVWSIPTRPYKGAHFAVFPESLVEPCILAGSRPGDIVLDPFMGSGTTAAVAAKLGRQYLGCELNPDYEPLQQQRLLNAVNRQLSLLES